MRPLVSSQKQYYHKSILSVSTLRTKRSAKQIFDLEAAHAFSWCWFFSKTAFFLWTAVDHKFFAHIVQDVQAYFFNDLMMFSAWMRKSIKVNGHIFTLNEFIESNHIFYHEMWINFLKCRKGGGIQSIGKQMSHNYFHSLWLSIGEGSGGIFIATRRWRLLLLHKSNYIDSAI